MSKLKPATASLNAVAVLATPAMAPQDHQNTRHVAKNTDTSATPAASYVDGRLCVPAPRVGAFATAPWENETPCEPAPEQGY